MNRYYCEEEVFDGWHEFVADDDLEAVEMAQKLWPSVMIIYDENPSGMRIVWEKPTDDLPPWMEAP